jgi:hypothetical protein
MIRKSKQLLLLVVVAAWALAACVDEVPSTAIELEVRSDLEVESELTSVRIEVFDRSEKELLRQQELMLGVRRAKGVYPLPLSLSLAAASQKSQRVLRIVVTGLRGSAVVVAQRALIGFRPNAVTPLQIFLSRACSGASCAASESCDPASGSCEPLPMTPPDEPEDDSGITDKDAGEAEPLPDADLDEPTLLPIARPDAATAEAGVDGGNGVPSDAGRDAQVAPVCAPRQVDLLLVMDNSASMANSQVAMSAQLASLLRGLMYGNRAGSSSPGATREFAPVDSVHVGIVSSDMGINGAPPQKSCGNLSFSPVEHARATTTTFSAKPNGDDGLLLISTAVAVDGVWASGMQLVPGEARCADVGLSAARPYAEIMPLSVDVERGIESARCVSKLGTNGCGFEQQLEAMLKALTPADSALRFFGDSRGQGDARDGGIPAGPNRGFLRDDALLVVLQVTDEDDCSSSDPAGAIFDPAASAYAGSVSVRCALAANQSALYSTDSRFAAGLRALKPSATKDRIIFSALTGVPVASATGGKIHSGSTALDAILARSEMQIQVRRNSSMTDDELVPACSTARTSAVPGRRIVQLARAFGSDGLVSSICEEEYASFSNVLLDRIVAKLACTK